ncbi:MAG: UDP-N-acetylmuramate:L-alanyl-gamma-D-glutamyl-meso-diaminopimelate ligase [Nitrospinaceae bacterium]
MIADSLKTFHIIAICGTGMAGLAGLLQAAGHRVTGSDKNIYPPMSTLLEQMGIPVQPGYRRENITADIDYVVVGNAISRGNEEVLAARDAGLSCLSFPETLSRFFLADKRSLVVAGTHGKTTTSALLSWTLAHAGWDPGFLVGGWLLNFDTNHRFGRGDCFVVEGDEYDTAFFDKGPKFLHYRPHAAILTGIEFDHADIFQNLDQIKSAFRRFVQIMDPGGFLLVAFSEENVKDVILDSPCPIETYGFSPEAHWSIDSCRFAAGQARFTLHHGGRRAGEFLLPMIGRHNVLNAAAVAALGLKLGLTCGQVSAAFAEFLGIKRRQEVVGEKNGILVMDDFAHHPTAIELTLEGVREAWPGRRLWAVFEPRSATSRRKVFETRFTQCFDAADRVVLAGPHAPEKIPPAERLDPRRVVETLAAGGKGAWYIPGVGDIVDFLMKELKPGDVVLIMSSGGFGGIHQQLLDRL